MRFVNILMCIMTICLIVMFNLEVDMEEKFYVELKEEINSLERVCEKLNEENNKLQDFIANMALKYKEIEDFAIKNNIIGFPEDASGNIEIL